MKKVFEIEWEGNVDLESELVERLLHNELSYVKYKGLKITEIKSSNFCYAPMSIEKKYCICEKPDAHKCFANDEWTNVCWNDGCGKEIKPTLGVEYCSCSPEMIKQFIPLRNVKDCPRCDKPSKPPIEKILDFVYSPDTTGFNMSRLKDKINQIIDWIENHSKGK